jgi:hypothetical protein
MGFKNLKVPVVKGAVGPISIDEPKEFYQVCAELRDGPKRGLMA